MPSRAPRQHVVAVVDARPRVSRASTARPHSPALAVVTAVAAVVERRQGEAEDASPLFVEQRAERIRTLPSADTIGARRSIRIDTSPMPMYIKWTSIGRQPSMLPPRCRGREDRRAEHRLRRAGAASRARSSARRVRRSRSGASQRSAMPKTTSPHRDSSTPGRLPAGRARARARSPRGDAPPCWRRTVIGTRQRSQCRPAAAAAIAEPRCDHARRCCARSPACTATKTAPAKREQQHDRRQRHAARCARRFGERPGRGRGEQRAEPGVPGVADPVQREQRQAARDDDEDVVGSR